MIACSCDDLMSDTLLVTTFRRYPG